MSNRDDKSWSPWTVQLDKSFPSLKKKKKPMVNNVDHQSEHTGNTEDHMPEPAADDVAGQAFYAVYQKGFRFGKGKGKGK